MLKSQKLRPAEPQSNFTGSYKNKVYSCLEYCTRQYQLEAGIVGDVDNVPDLSSMVNTIPHT